MFPVQKVILKAYYGLALDTKKRNVRITDWKHQNERILTEAEYLEWLYEQGRSNIREVVAGDRRRDLVLAIGRRSGKCVLGGTLVLTNQGLLKIRDLLPDPNLPENQSAPLRVQVAQEGSRRADTSHFYNGGVKTVRELTTRCGYQLGGTDNHRIKVLYPDGAVRWKYLADLREGDIVAVHRGTNLWAVDPVDCRSHHVASGQKEVRLPEILDERWGLLLGCLVGDGHWTKRSSVAMTMEDPEMWDQMQELFSELLGHSSTYMDKRTANTGDLQFHSVAVREFLHRLGWRWDLERDQKEIPWSILQSPRSVVAAFLRGLFETDGCAESQGQSVTFSSASEVLARQVQTVLLNFGIVSFVFPKPVHDKTYWILRVRGTNSRRIFAQEIGFLTDRKMCPLLESFREDPREGGDTEAIPYQQVLARQLLESVPKNVSGKGWTRSALRAALGNVIKPSSGEPLTYPRLRKVIQIARDVEAQDSETLAHFQGVLDTNYFFDPVVSITEREEQVWDLTVPNGHAFVANGMVNHNTEMAAWITSYEIYKLLRKPNPQGYYGIPPGDEIKLCAVATGRDQAGELYAKAKHYFLDCTLFDPYRANMTTTYSRFQTQHDIESYGRYGEHDVTQATIKATFYSCIAKGLRGAGNIVVVLDEIAHFVTSGQSSGKEVYKAVTPSIAAFSPKDPDKSVSAAPSRTDGRVILISSPLGRDGFFYQKFRQGFERSESMLCIQAPTWEVNPSISAEDLEGFYLDDPTDFFTEFGAEFSDRTRGWIERREDLVHCIDPKLSRLLKAPARQPHFMGIDVGVTKGGDGTAVAIGHIDKKQQIVLDYIEWIRAGEGKYAHLERLDFEDIADWIVSLGKKFHITEGIMDRWAGLPMEQYLQKKGMRQIVSQLFTPKDTTFMYKTFKDMMWDGRLRLYNWRPNPTGSSGVLLGSAEEGTLCDYLEELLSLQEEKISRHVSSIEAPKSGDKHDDRSDALIRMVWLASQKLGNPKFIAGGAGGASAYARATGYGNRPQTQLGFLRRARLGGSHPSRQIISRLTGNPGGFPGGGRM